MRRLVLATAMCGMAFGAQAADMPDLPVLRGSVGPLSTTTRNWDGWYVGGQAGYTSSTMDFSRSVASLTNFIFRNSAIQTTTSGWSLLGRDNPQGTSFGGFVGRNFQIEDIVLGVEANYNYVNKIAGKSAGAMELGITNPTGSVTPPNHTYTYYTSLDGRAAATLKDVLTFRGRAGWVAGNWMPYMFGGLAVGRVDISRSVDTNVRRQDDEFETTTDILGNVTTRQVSSITLPVPALTQSASEHKTNAFAAGWTAGLGVEYCLWGSIFVRGEWEYTKFVQIKDTPISLNTVRAGIGYKF